jgi:D-sedoheptulose 7-phosphate isomerase
MTHPNQPDLAEHRVACQTAVVGALDMRQTRVHDAFAELRGYAGSIAAAAELMIDALRDGRKVMVAGNGGSAAQSQHFAAELVGRFQRERGAYAALALTTDTSILTAIGNDYGYQDVFARQIFGLGLAGDVLLLLSTSGESENLVRAAVAARQCRIPVIAVTGSSTCRLGQLADVTVCTSGESAVAQEMHLLLIHILCDIIETELAQGESAE